MKNGILSILFSLSCVFQFSYAACPECCNGVQDCTETGIDCGGPDCPACDNLVPNPSFECITACPTQETTAGVNSLALAAPWNYVGVGGTPDLFNECFVTGPSWQPGVPISTWGDQTARTGVGYAGILVYNPFEDDQRDYLQAPLNEPLTAGKEYDITFYVSLADNYQYAIDGIGVRFSVGPMSAPDYLPLSWSGIFPHFTSPTGPGQEITDKVNWTSISGRYIAAGGEDHIVIGNFKDNFTPFNTWVGTGSREQSYYFVDDIDVVPVIPFPVRMVTLTADAFIDGNVIEWSTSQELNSAFFEVERRKREDTFESLGTVAAAGESQALCSYRFKDTQPITKTHFYRLKSVDVNGQFNYSEVLSVVRSKLNPVFTCIPDRFNQTYEVFYQGEELGNTLELEVLDLLGHSVLHTTMKSNGLGAFESSLNVQSFSPGIYFIKISTLNQIHVRRVLI